MRELIRAHWGLGSKTLADWFLPGADDTDAARAWFASLQREAASAEMPVALLDAAMREAEAQSDLFPCIRVPTLSTWPQERHGFSRTVLPGQSL